MAAHYSKLSLQASLERAWNIRGNSGEMMYLKVLSENVFFFFNEHSITCSSACSIWPGNAPGRQSLKYYGKAKRMACSKGRRPSPQSVVHPLTQALHMADSGLWKRTPSRRQERCFPSCDNDFPVVLPQNNFHAREECNLPPEWLFHLRGSRGFLSSPSFPIPRPTLERTGEALSLRKSLNDSSWCNLPDGTVV